MQDISPPDKTARREKRLVDRTYSLPLAKITISSWLRELMESKFDQDVVATVPNSVNHETFYPDSTQNDRGLSVLIPYRTQTWKGQGETRQLVENLQQRDDTRIMLFGPERGFGWAADSVDTFSNLSDSELRQLYSSADIFVLPSWTEGFGLPVLEAMACECAVVTTNVGTVLDYTHEEFPAAIVPPRDASELTSATVELLADATKRETLQRQGREFVTDFSWEDATNRFENALYKIIE